MVSMSKMASNIFNNSTHNNTNRTTLTATKMNLTHYKLTPSLYTYIHNVHPERNAWYRPHPTIISPNKYDLQHTHPFPLCTSRKKKDKDTSSICFYQVTSFPRGVWRVHHPVINTTGGGPQQMQNPTLVTRYS